MVRGSAVARVVVPWAVTASCSLASAPSRAASSDVEVRVNCPDLPREPEAELEARARVDLALRSSPGGELQITCDGSDAELTWRPSDGGTFSRTITVDLGGAKVVDVLLAAMTGLVTDTGSSSQPATAIRPEPPKPEVDRPVAPGHRIDPARPLALGISLGALTQIWGTSQGAAGPELGLLLGLTPRWVGSMSFEYGVGWASSHAVDVRIASATVMLSAWFGHRPAFEFGIGASGGAVQASIAPPYGPSPQSARFLAAVLRARYALEARALRLVFGPELRVYTAPTTVMVDGAAAWRMPVLTAGVTLDVNAPLYGRLW